MTILLKNRVIGTDETNANLCKAYFTTDEMGHWRICYKGDINGLREFINQQIERENGSQ